MHPLNFLLKNSLILLPHHSESVHPRCTGLQTGSGQIQWCEFSHTSRGQWGWWCQWVFVGVSEEQFNQGRSSGVSSPIHPEVNGGWWLVGVRGSQWGVVEIVVVGRDSGGGGDVSGQNQWCEFYHTSRGQWGWWWLVGVSGGY